MENSETQTFSNSYEKGRGIVMRKQIQQLGSNSGFTLVEVIISMLILSMIAASTLIALVYALRISSVNQYEMAATNLANDRIEYIRSLSFAEVGTKSVVGATVIYGDPKGEIPQTESVLVDGIKYLVNTTISWEDQSGWEMGNIDWDYKSVRVEVIPQVNSEKNLVKKVETLVTRDSTQPILMGANIGVRMIRGWKIAAMTVIPIPNLKISLTSGPSAPRQVQTSSSGIARFIDLDTGTYNVHIDPTNNGMMLLPDQSPDLSMSITEGMTETKELEAEYPCYLKLSLKNLNGAAISIGSGITGTVKVDVPYGTDISKSFSTADLDSSGSLSENYLGGLWPVGSGYSGVYTVTDISIPNSTYFGAYEVTSSGEELWTGTFDAPATNKEVICYLGVVPETPSDIDVNWATTVGEIKTDDSPYLDGKAVFSTADKRNSIIMPTNTSSEFNAASIYFDNTGSATNPGLIIGKQSTLTLNSALVVFRGRIQLEDAGRPEDTGRICFSTVYSDGTPSHQIPGSVIGGLAYHDKMYGKLYLVKPLIHNGVTIVNPGGYYFYDGLVLPDNASELIPITKENYAD
jgi:prepilin-type N-terminal cleavage/methylation domain-containing protein